MKKVAIILAVLLVLALLGVGFLYIDCSVAVTAIGVAATEAQAQPVLFQNLADQLSSDSVQGIRFTDSSYLDSIENYQFLTYNLRLKNTCFLAADMIELQITPQPGDILQIGDITPKTLSAQSTGDIQATILTRSDMHSAREILVTYYMWGMPLQLKVFSTK